MKTISPQTGLSAAEITLIVIVTVGLAAAILLAGKYWGRQASAGNPLTDGTTRQFLTLSIFLVSAGGILALAITTIRTASGEDQKENVRLVFAAIIPLLASWVGTVIAYYYSREKSGCRDQQCDSTREGGRPEAGEHARRTEDDPSRQDRHEAAH